MTVRELIEMLEEFDGDMEVRIGMRQNFGTNFAMYVGKEVEERKIRSHFGADYRAVVITEGSQCGAVVYYEDEDEEWS